ncbi:MAG TPA: ATP-binding protein [Polyangia bacterium]
MAPETDSPTRLGAWLKRNRDRVLQRWEESAKQIAAGKRLDRLALLDTIPKLIDQIVAAACEVDSAASPLDAATSHALDRLNVGFELHQIVAEYGALRLAIIELLDEEKAEPPFRPSQIAVVDRIIDAAVAVAAERFSQARNRTLVALDRISLSALKGPQPKPQSVLEDLCKTLVETIEAVDTATVLMREGDLLVTKASVGLEEEQRTEFTVPLGRGYAGRIAAGHAPLSIRGEAINRIASSPVVHETPLCVLYGVPLESAGSVIGVAHMGSKSTFEFSEEDKVLFRVMATRATQVIVLARGAEQREQLVHELQRSEEELRALADNIPQLAWIADDRGNVFWYNKRWLDYTGATLDEMTGWRWQKLHHPAHLQRVVEKFKQHLASGERWEDTFPLLGKDGKYRWFLSRALPIRDSSGRVVRWFGTNTDVTEHARLEEAREQFIGILGHDLRNPLNAIVMATAILKKSVLEPGPERAVGRIASSAERMRRMISDLLDFTRGRLGGGIPIAPKPTDLRAICRAVLDEVEAVNPERRIGFSAEGDTAGTWDDQRLGQVVQNLVSNAIQHGDSKSPILLAIDGRDPDSVTLSVSNQGSTIPAALLPDLFEPFRRLAKSGENPESGSTSLGLGLFIVAEVARAHGGQVRAESTDERGTRFEVRLPRVPPKSG